MRAWLLVALVLVSGCHKASPRSTRDRPHEAEQIRTLTHDTDLAAPEATEDVLKRLGSASLATP